MVGCLFFFNLLSFKSNLSKPTLFHSITELNSIIHSATIKYVKGTLTLSLPVTIPDENRYPLFNINLFNAFCITHSIGLFHKKVSGTSSF